MEQSDTQLSIQIQKAEMIANDRALKNQTQMLYNKRMNRSRLLVSPKALKKLVVLNRTSDPVILGRYPA